VRTVKRETTAKSPTMTASAARLVEFRTGAADEAGASAVEFALVMPVLVLFVAGIVDFGMLFSNLTALHQGVGAAVRQGVVGKPGTLSNCSVVGLSSGIPVETTSLICLTKDRIGLEGSRVKVSFPGAKTKGGALLVCAQYPLESLTGFFDPMLSGVLKSKLQMRIEQDLTGYAATEETALPGGTWTWCS
jgi:Flp pilus assembly pilin Flp